MMECRLQSICGIFQQKVMMKIYYIWVDEYDYDEHDSYVVVAENEDKAKNLTSLVNSDAHIKEIGIPHEHRERIVCDSYNAG